MENIEIKNLIVLQPGKHLLKFIKPLNRHPIAEFATLELNFNVNGRKNHQEFILLPDGARTYWLVDTPVELRIVSDDISITKISNFKKIIFLLLGTRLQKEKYVYRHEIEFGPSFLAVGHRNRKSKVWSHLKALKLFGLLPNSRKFSGNTEFVRPRHENEGGISDKCVRSDTPKNIAVVLHLHFDDLWQEVSQKLMQFPQKFDLFVTLTRADSDLENQIETQFPGVHIHIVKNRGRDIGPFFYLMRSINLSSYELICKIHGKKTLSNGIESPFGMLWRRKCLLDLLGSRQQICSILEMFKTNSQLGMVGPDTLRLPNKNYSISKSWSNNKMLVLSLIDRLDLKAGDDDLDFFAGSMFWCRGNVIEKFEQLGLADNEFTEEQHQLPDGRIEHALERVFGMLVKQSGMHLDSPAAYRSIPAPGNKS